MNRRKIVKERQNYGMQEVSSGAAQDKGKQGELAAKGMDKTMPKFTALVNSKPKVGETTKISAAPSRLKEGELATEGVNKPNLKLTAAQSNLKEGKFATQSKHISGQPSPKRMKKSIPKKLDFSHLQSTFDAIGRRVNTLPPTLGEQQSTPPEQPTYSKSKDVSKNQGPQPTCNNNTIQSTSVTQQRSSGASAQITGEQMRQNNVQVAQERIQEWQEHFPLPTSDSLPEAEDNLMDQDGPEMEKGRPILRATTIDEFLKENGTDVDLDGLCIDEQSDEQNSEEEDSMALN
ncbi:hypothetical protein PIB30_067332 [Stylosanthes scabra]|uniref:Uncharacterized protein n=1 Tax=Stylosanthes scabra TaxID=79078 RepID=A0ABU6VNH7_9FABA|nr:hypothetical protein [Stylosanthes scabra]